MNVLMLGKGKGSWEMRGQQLGAALGARVLTEPGPKDWEWADLVVILKRWVQHGAEAHRRGLPIVWDALDFWGQPSQNSIAEPVAKQILANHIQALRPAMVIGATEAMASAAGGVYLPHHSWDRLVPTPPRLAMRTVAYQGNPLYLGSWRAALDRQCADRGWTFAVNPADLSSADVIVALRGEVWDGWVCREWKSGVKLVNAIAAGRPVITQPTAAWREMQPPGYAIETMDELKAALDLCGSPLIRTASYERCREAAPQYRLPAVAKRYTEILEAVRQRTPCTT